MTRQEQKTGKVGEAFAARALANLGILQLERVGTPVKLIPVKAGNLKGIFRVIFGEKVIGDWRGILPGGRSVLAEVKTVLQGNLTYSHMRPHQPEGLSYHAKQGGLSLLVWVAGQDEIYILRWPIPGFEPGHGLTIEQAKDMALRSDDRPPAVRCKNCNHLWELHEPFGVCTYPKCKCETHMASNPLTGW